MNGSLFWFDESCVQESAERSETSLYHALRGEYEPHHGELERTYITILLGKWQACGCFLQMHPELNHDNYVPVRRCVEALVINAPATMKIYLRCVFSSFQRKRRTLWCFTIMLWTLV